MKKFKDFRYLLGDIPAFFETFVKCRGGRLRAISSMGGCRLLKVSFAFCMRLAVIYSEKTFPVLF